MPSTIRSVIREPFPPGRLAPCFCGSGQRFKHCCGGAGQRGVAPYGIGIVPDFLGTDECRRMVELAGRCHSERLKVFDPDRSTPGKTVMRLDDRRVTERVDLRERHSVLDGWVRRALTNEIAPTVGREFEWFERPQLLKYGSGGFYQGHADSDLYLPDRQVWQKTLDRDISLLIYLNEEFTGGELHFEHFGFKIRPRAGMLVYFPSDARYMHAAQPVASGLRYAVVSWAAFSDEPRVKEQPPQKAVALRDA
jgi:hypothetical protein